MKYSEENIDLMLFDYLEGDLTSNEVSQIEMQIASDPLISEELNTWRKTYIKAELSDTKFFETQLLQPINPFSFTLFINSILVICLTLISSTNRQLIPSSTPMTNNQNLYSITAKQPISQLSYSIIDIEPFLIRPTANFTPSHKVASKEVEGTEYKFIPNSAMVTFSPKWADYPMSYPKSIKFRREIDLLIITPKELRKKDKALRRMRKKAQRDRMASEFIKGDIPYVVPVNPTNF